MRILVTGGAGFIGGHLAERFVDEGHDVVVLDTLHRSYARRIKERTVNRCRERATRTDGSYRFVEGDVRDDGLVTELVADADCVSHHAALTGVRRSVDHPRSYHEVNVDGTLNVLDAARGTEVERVVVASSSSVYGEPRYLPCDEDHPTKPISPYGATKLAAEQYTVSYGKVFDIPVTGLRYFSVYGPRMRPNMAISNFVSRCANGMPPVVYGDGSQTRDFTYIDDVVEANVSLLDTAALDGEVVNVGSTDTVEILTLAEEIRDLVAPELAIEFAERHLADVEHTHADTSKARDAIGYEPTHTTRDGLEAFVEWYRANREWYEAPVVSSQ